MATIDDSTGCVVGGNELDDDYSRCILPRVMDNNMDDLH